MSKKDSNNKILKFFGTVLGPVWLPVYWVWQLILGLVGLCYYIVVERTRKVLFPSRYITSLRTQVHWYLTPLLFIGLIPALAVQLLVALASLFVWWHSLLGKWQSGIQNKIVSVIAGLLAEAVLILVFVGSLYHNLPWWIIGHDTVPVRWYHSEGVDPIRCVLTGPVLIGVLLLLIFPTIFMRKRKIWQILLFPLRSAMAIAVLYHSLLSYESGVNHSWLMVSCYLLAGLLAIALMKIASKTLSEPTVLRQFVWFSSIRLLEKKRIALFSLGAVTLCTMMLLIIVSVMGGFVEQVRSKTHGLMGDIIIEGDPARGFPYYQGFLNKMKEPPLNKIVQQATPVIYTAGLFRVRKPYNPKAFWTSGVKVQGIDLRGKIAVSTFGKGLHYYQKDPKSVILNRPIKPIFKKNAEKLYGLIYGLDVGTLAYRDADGHYHRSIGQYWPATLSVFPITLKGTLVDATAPAVTQKFYLIDDSRTGVYDIDSTSVYIDFKVLQRLLYMDEQKLNDGSIRPARTHQIQIKLRKGIRLYQGLKIIKAAWFNYAMQFDDPLIQDAYPGTWEEYNASFISAVENEKRLMIMLFGIISIIVVFLILVIFYMIVVEKTKDIGILKSIGASESQIAAIFLAYAGVIGLVGSITGTIFGYYFVKHINGVQNWLIDVFGWRVWNREVYAFDRIPSKIDVHDAIVIVIAAILASIIGAIIPALRAAKMNPVEALRYE